MKLQIRYFFEFKKKQIFKVFTIKLTKLYKTLFEN